VTDRPVCGCKFARFSRIFDTLIAHVCTIFEHVPVNRRNCATYRARALKLRYSASVPNPAYTEGFPKPP